MIKLQIIPEREVSLQVLEPVVKPVIAPKRITENGSYFAKAEGVSGFDSVTVAVDLTPAFEAGQKAEYDRFWDFYQQNGERTDYSMLFSGAGWTAETFKPKYLIRPGGAGNHYMMFARTGVEVLDETILDTSQCTAFSMSFYNSSRLKSITIDIKSLKAFTDVFNFDGALERVVLKNVPETCNFTGGFSGCNKLADFTVTGTIGGTILNLSWSSMLTDASVRSILGALKDRKHMETATLTFHADVGKRLTEAQKAEITAKNWILVY